MKFSKLSQFYIKWVPVAPPPEIKKKFKTEVSLLSGFGAAAVKKEPIEDGETGVIKKLSNKL